MISLRQLAAWILSHRRARNYGGNHSVSSMRIQEHGIRYSEMEYIDPTRSLVVKTFLAGLIKQRLFHPGAAIAAFHGLEPYTAQCHFDLDGQLHRFLDALRARVNPLTFVERGVESVDEVRPLFDPDTDRSSIVRHGTNHAGLQDSPTDRTEAVA